MSVRTLPHDYGGVSPITAAEGSMYPRSAGSLLSKSSIGSPGGVSTYSPVVSGASGYLASYTSGDLLAPSPGSTGTVPSGRASSVPRSTAYRAATHGLGSGMLAPPQQPMSSVFTNRSSQPGAAQLLVVPPPRAAHAGGSILHRPAAAPSTQPLGQVVTPARSNSFVSPARPASGHRYSGAVVPTTAAPLSSSLGSSGRYMRPPAPRVGDVQSSATLQGSSSALDVGADTRTPLHSLSRPPGHGGRFASTLVSTPRATHHQPAVLHAPAAPVATTITTPSVTYMGGRRASGVMSPGQLLIPAQTTAYGSMHASPSSPISPFLRPVNSGYDSAAGSGHASPLQASSARDERAPSPASQPSSSRLQSDASGRSQHLLPLQPHASGAPLPPGRPPGAAGSRLAQQAPLTLQRTSSRGSSASSGASLDVEVGSRRNTQGAAAQPATHRHGVAVARTSRSSSDDSDDTALSSSVGATPARSDRAPARQRMRMGACGGSSGSSGSQTSAQSLSPTTAVRLAQVARVNFRDCARGTGCVGLSNLGNTCFMNSILQALNAVPELVAWCHTASAAEAARPGARLASAYVDLVRAMWRAEPKGVVSPSSFLNCMARVDRRWGDMAQQDAQELLHALLEGLQADWNAVPGKPAYRELSGKGSQEEQAAEADTYARSWHDSIIDDIFGGLMQSTLACQVCGRQSHCFEPFLDLALPIPASCKGGSVTIHDCLKAFVEEERLEGSESVRCEVCKKCCPHTKRLQIWRPPRVLVLTLKRFSQRNSGSSFLSRFRSTSKNSASVCLDVNALQLAACCNPAGLRALSEDYTGPEYHLVSVSHHSGSLEGGHYTASARSVADGQWYSFNDSHVRADSPPQGASSSAYVLVYRMSLPA